MDNIVAVEAPTDFEAVSRIYETLRPMSDKRRKRILQAVNLILGVLGEEAEEGRLHAAS